LHVAPVVWSLIGLQAALLFGVHPDYGLGVAAFAAVALRVRSARRSQRVAPA
jgi:hypothetical protein